MGAAHPEHVGRTASVFVVAADRPGARGDRRAEGSRRGRSRAVRPTMILGHVLLTSTFDLLTWPLVCLFVLRALLREEGRWWLYAGAVAGVGVVRQAARGLAPARHRRRAAAGGSAPRLVTRSLLLGCGWCPSCWRCRTWSTRSPTGGHSSQMGAALAENNAGEVRWFMWVLLLLVLGPTLVPIWVAGLVGMVRRPEWRSVRCIVVAFGVVLLLTFVSGAQPHYPTGLLVVLLAAGAVPTAERMRLSRGWTALVAAAVAREPRGLRRPGAARPACHRAR